jgi:hypothetical protein
MKSIETLIKLERYIYNQVKNNTLTYYELLKYLEHIESIDMFKYSDNDLAKYLNCLEELYGDGEVKFPAIDKVHRKINFSKFPPICLN